MSKSQPDSEARPWIVIMHQKTVYGPFDTEAEARAWAADQVKRWNYPSRTGEVHFGTVDVMEMLSPGAKVK